MSAATLPMGSGDYAYADACTKQGAYYHPVRQLPRKPPAKAAVIATPGPDGHIPLGDVPLTPPPALNMDQRDWTNLRNTCQHYLDESYAGKRVDLHEGYACTSVRMATRVYGHLASPMPSSSPAGSPLPMVTPTPGGVSLSAICVLFASFVSEMRSSRRRSPHRPSMCRLRCQHGLFKDGIRKLTRIFGGAARKSPIRARQTLRWILAIMGMQTHAQRRAPIFIQ